MPPLVVDASSDFTTKPITWRQSNVGILFACASKNIGHAGITVVIVRKDLLSEENRNPMTPGFLDYKVNIDAGNVWNTIPTFNVEVVNIMFEWMRECGGIEVMERQSVEKAKMVYDVIDESGGFYGTPLPMKIEYRSRMNVPFCIVKDCDDGTMSNDEELTNLFLVECWKRGIVGLKTVTPFKQGIYLRASLYHGVSFDDVVVLTGFMKEFAAAHRWYGSTRGLSNVVNEMTVVEEEETKEMMMTTLVEEKKEDDDEHDVSVVSPSSSIVDLSHLSSSPTGVVMDMSFSLTLPKNFKVSRYAKITKDMFAPPPNVVVAGSCSLSR
jgi:hypothetical protein